MSPRKGSAVPKASAPTLSVEDLSVVAEVSQAIAESSALSLSPLLEIAHTQLSTLLNTENFFIALYDEHTGVIEFKFATEGGIRQPVGRKEWAPRQGGEGLTECVIKKAGPLYIANDVQGWMAREGVSLIGRPAKSWLGVPLQARGRILGVLALQDYEHDNAYSSPQVTIVSILARQIAIAIANLNLISFQRALIISVPHPVIAVDRKGRVTHANESAGNIVNIDREKLYGRTVEDFYWFGKQDAKKVNDSLLHSRERVEAEVFVRSSNQRKIPVHLSAAPIIDRDDREDPPRVLGSVAILTDLRFDSLRGRIRDTLVLFDDVVAANNMADLSLSLHLLICTVFGSVAVCFLVKRPAGFLVESVEGSDGQLRLGNEVDLSSTLQEPVQNTYSFQLPRDGYQSLSPNSKNCLLIPLVRTSLPLGALLIESNSPEEFIEDTSLLTLLQRQASAALGRVLLIEEKERLQAQLARSAEQIATGRIAAGVSHDVKGGLHAIAMALINVTNSVKSLGGIKGSGKILEYLGVAERRVDALTNLARRLHSFSQDFHPVKSRCYLNDVVAEPLVLLQSACGEKNSDLRLELDPILNSPGATPAGAKPLVADGRQIQQVVINLVLNAIDASKHRDPIVLRTRFRDGRSGDAGWATFTVKDYGKGIPSSDLREIFEPFFTRKDNGTGLGLYICRLIVEENHAGSFEIVTKVGKGTEITVRLPIATSADLKRGEGL